MKLIRAPCFPLIWQGQMTVPVYPVAIFYYFKQSWIYVLMILNITKTTSAVLGLTFENSGVTTGGLSMNSIIKYKTCYNHSMLMSLQWRHNKHDGISNHQPHNCLFRRRSKEISKLRVTGLCVGNSPVTGEFPAQRASNAENVSIWWRHPVSSRFSNHTTVRYYVKVPWINLQKYIWVWLKKLMSHTW